ncbi:MAG: IS110 family transposase [Acidimicrobiia bacterium]|nr:IS110 family transposase [Acidimicrobiia bacterium]
MTEQGEVLESVRIDNDPVALGLEIAKAGDDPEVVLEATYGWYWAADVLEASGANVHLAHPLGMKGFENRRVKNDTRDAGDLADVLRMNRLPEAWIAPPELRELRELVRYRAKLVALRSGLKAQVHAVIAKVGIPVPMTDLFGVAGNELLDELELPGAYAHRIRSLRELIDIYDDEVATLAGMIAAELDSHDGYQAIQAICGIGPVLAAVFVAEIGDVGRFPSPRHLASWSGLTPRHYESDTTIRRGRITKQGSRLVRWAALEAVARQRGGTHLQRTYHQLMDRRNSKGIAKVAVARKVLHLVYYGLRDGEIRCLAPAA